ncbi:MAG: AtpZ/AtpI family protein [Desulfovibrio sp.]|nr:AtpZ/AtpI family protein [Desulfovibrio sp.]
MPGAGVSFRDFFGQQREGMRAMATTGVMGLHLVSGPLVGFAIGYGLDAWLGTSPWCKIIFLLLGIGAGFLNVYRDTQVLLRKLENERRHAGAAVSAANDGTARPGAGAPASGRPGTPPPGKKPHLKDTDTGK